MYQRILVPIDGSTPSNQGLNEAIKLALLTGARLRLIHVMGSLIYATGFGVDGDYNGDLILRMEEAGKQVLEDGKTRATAAKLEVDSLLIDGLGMRVSEAVIQQTKEWGADLIVIGTHGRRGANRLLLGSDAEQIMRLAPVPVLLVRTPEATAKDYVASQAQSSK